ncbi:MAG: HNH endonuclease signature motif containing protein [Pseudomonadota bacterium]
MVDHVRRRPKGATGPTAADVLANLQCLCGACHNAKTNRIDGGFGNQVRSPSARPTVRGCDADGWPFDPKRR